jgi:NAD(P)H-flavin reductase
MSKESDQDDYYELQIVNRVKETPDTYTYSFSPTTASQKFRFSIGQFVTINAFLRRPTTSGKFEESLVQRAYSIASSPTRDLVELTIKDEKPYGYINPITGKADGFSAYFFEQTRVGDKIKVKLNSSKDHFLSKIDAGIEKNIAYWSGFNGAESARCLIQYIEDIRDPEIYLTLFYSNPRLYLDEDERTVNVIYYDWLIEKAKKIENFKIVFTFTRQEEPALSSDHPRIVYRKGRFFVGPNGELERTLMKYHGNTDSSYNPICGSSGFINGIVKLPNGKIEKGRGIMQDLIEIEGVKPEKIDKEQYYLQVVGAHK